MLLPLKVLPSILTVPMLRIAPPRESAAPPGVRYTGGAKPLLSASRRMVTDVPAAAVNNWTLPPPSKVTPPVAPVPSRVML